MFIDFFYLLRQLEIPVSLTEWLTLMKALDLGLTRSSLASFYYLARSVLIKNESYYDKYDQAFLHFFKDAELSPTLRGEIEDWLKNPLPLLELSAEEKALLEMLEDDDLRRLFEERLREQDSRHDGGGRWIGTGGTSPFGHGGYNPKGIRVGGEGHWQRAMQVAGRRQYYNYRSDLVLDTRQISTALKSLRVLRRIGSADELDVDESIDRTCRDAGEIHLVFRPERKNAVKLLLLMDVGGTMMPYAALVERLFSAAHQATHFKDFQHYYFHNCLYEQVFTEAFLWQGLPTEEVFKLYGDKYWVIIVGDAYMYAGEILHKYGAIDYYHRNEIPGGVWLNRLRQNNPRSIWLNPRPARLWGAASTRLIRNIFPMFPLTLEGLEAGIKCLSGAKLVEPEPLPDLRQLDYYSEHY